MCILIVLRDRVAGWPLVVGANRDEVRDRPWEPPRRTGSVLAPRDLRAGGTWLALNEAGLLVAVTNRPDPSADASRPSRGLLAMDLAATGDPDRARSLFEEVLSRERRNAFRVLVASADAAWVGIHPAAGGAWGETVEVPAGMHTLTNRWGLDELDHRGALDGADLPPGTPLSIAVERLRTTLGTHGDRGPAGRDAICKHEKDRGTLSSAIVAIPKPGAGRRPRMIFAPGPPCRTDFVPV